MNNEIDAIADSSTFGSFEDITSILGTANTAACDVEFMCVTA
jgi:hypothetical protein